MGFIMEMAKNKIIYCSIMLLLKGIGKLYNALIFTFPYPIILFVHKPVVPAPQMSQTKSPTGMHPTEKPLQESVFECGIQ